MDRLPTVYRVASVTQQTNQSPDAGPAERFVALADGSSFWKSVDLRICAIRSGRRWVNLVTRGFLDHRAPGSVTKFPPVERPDVRAWQVVRPIADLPAVVRGIVDGMMRLRPRFVRYTSQSDQLGMDMRCHFNEVDRTTQCRVRPLERPLARWLWLLDLGRGEAGRSRSWNWTA